MVAEARRLGLPIPRRAQAGLVSRLAALTVDVAIVSALVFSVRVLPTAAWTEVLHHPEPPWLRAGASLAAATVPFLYFTTSWWLANQTVGDMLLGLSVLRHDGGEMSLLHAAVRAAIGLALAPLWFVGLLPILWDEHRRAWIDRVTRTVVRYVHSPH